MGSNKKRDKGLARDASLIFYSDVAKEVKASYGWYHREMTGLSYDFIKVLESAYEAIEELPLTWPKFENNCRRFVLSKFSFSVIYHHSENSVFVIAVFMVVAPV